MPLEAGAGRWSWDICGMEPGGLPQVAAPAFRRCGMVWRQRPQFPEFTLEERHMTVFPARRGGTTACRPADGPVIFLELRAASDKRGSADSGRLLQGMRGARR
jgi:hypothetical protein